MHLTILKVTGLNLIALLRKSMITIVKQNFHRGKTKEWLEIKKKRQKDAKTMEINSFQKGRDYRREVMQTTATGGFASGMEDRRSSDASTLFSQNILPQTSRYTYTNYRLPRVES